MPNESLTDFDSLGYFFEFEKTVREESLCWKLASETLIPLFT